MTRQTAPMIIGILLLAGCGGYPGADGGESSSITVSAVRSPLTIVVPAEGELEATQASPIAVPRVPTGALKVKQLVDEGTIVEEGQIVVVFDDTELNIELDNHRASFRSTNRQIDRTQLQSVIETGSIGVMKEVAELERDNIEAFEIVDETIYSRQEILEDEVRLDTAEETILFADASLLLRGEYYDIEERILGVEKGQVSGKIERVETSLGQLVLKAPIGGLIVYKKNWRGGSVGVGDSLWPGNVIMSIVDPKSVALKAFVLERDAAGLVEGAEASVSVDARPAHDFRGQVKSVAEISRPIQRGSPVKYCEVSVEILDGDVELLMPGMKGEARIVTGRLEEAVIIPRSALRGEADAPYVFVRTASGAERRAVKLGPGDLVRVSIEDGLSGGERVVIGDEQPLAEDEQNTARSRRGTARSGGA
jgi:multidrug efflux pump subunit AcrA (membrane-fusion protein)